MRAQLEFEELRTAGWRVVERWLREKAEETSFLEFKRYTADPGDLLGKAISSFANTEGGLIVFGLEAGHDSTSKIDRVQGEKLVPDVEVFKASVLRLISAVVDPAVTGVLVHALVKPTGDGKEGVVALLVPESISGPHRSRKRGVYYMRLQSGAEPMPHAMLAALFGRRPQPDLRVMVSRPDETKLLIGVANIGRGYAEKPELRLWVGSRTLEEESETLLGMLKPTADVPVPVLEHQSSMWNLRTHSLGSAFVRIFRIEPMFAGDREVVAHLRFTKLDPRFKISGRVDALGAPPLTFAAPIPVLGADDLVLPHPDIR